MSSPETKTGSFRTWNGREPYEIHEGVRLHAIGGEQVLLCRVVYAPGQRVPRASHDHPEQVMVIVEGAIELTVEEETQTRLPGDVAVINPGMPHALYSENGVTFMEALAPVPLDHVPDRDLDLVLGPGGGATHVER